MKKLLFVLAIGAFAACNNSASTDTKPVDSAATKPADSVVAAPAPADSTAKAPVADSTKKDSVVKKK